MRKSLADSTLSAYIRSYDAFRIACPTASVSDIESPHELLADYIEELYEDSHGNASC